ncbi:MAG: TrkH family potassium uptake protein [Planctomycetaceae bacterium]|nr:TrkH family potassium uptake protein [Planctomycetaceae bacterium]
MQTWQKITPPQLFVGSFGLLVLFGTLGLRWLPGLYTGERLSWLDALFTSTSAVCVTGLIVQDTAQFFTPAGQAFILLLIQLGGLGMLTFTSLIIMALGKRLSLTAEASSIVASDNVTHIDRRRLGIDIVRFTLVFEAVGALLLYLIWGPRMGWREAAWPALFHSISAFCNAGFSVFSDSLIQFQNSPLSLLVVMMLILAGGLGFLTHEEMYLWWQSKRRKRAFRISLQSRMVVVVTFLVTICGWLFFALFEWNNLLGSMQTGDKLINSLFMSVTPRTAGFNSIDYAQATDSSNLLTMIFMMVGGSPGSTAGGLKTTTFALIGLLAWSRLRGWEHTSCWSRSVPEATTSRAVGLFVIASGLAIGGVFFLTATESNPDVTLIKRMFEACSAFNTVGLSMGITGGLSTAGRWVIILMMFFGRVGLLTLASSLTIQRSQCSQFRYSYEDVVVG